MASKPVIPQNDNIAHALAGAGGGILSMILTYPLMTLSTRAQVESKRSETAFLAAVKRIVAREGVAGLYAGLDSAVFGISVTNFVYYYWYEWSRAFFEAAATRAGRASKKLTTVESMIAGALAGSATVILTNPIWVVNTRMTTRQEHLKESGELETEPSTASTDDTSSSSAVAVEAEEKEKEKQKKPEAKAPTTVGTLLALLREEGPQALFRGVVPALVLVINPILQYTLFEQMKNAVERRRRQRITPAVAFFLGALGKLFATSVTYPYITVKSQMHVAGNGQKEGMTQAIRRVVREEGYAGLYKGIGPKVTQSVLTAAFLFAFKDVLYEQTVRLRGTVARKAVKA
ncbi:mitochondrial carrier [Xylariaceae sp. FL0662B]|nr:mitochondrial carrier [Xylariaceae sp. FL0662B]